MTKADLIDEVSSALNLTTKESDVIVQSIFGSMVKALRRGEKSRSVASAVSTRGSGGLALGAIPRPANALRCPPRRFRTSGPAKKFAP
jgi:hypothetical protein